MAFEFLAFLFGMKCTGFPVFGGFAFVGGATCYMLDFRDQCHVSLFITTVQLSFLTHCCYYLLIDCTDFWSRSLTCT